MTSSPVIAEANDEFVAACKNFGEAEVVFLGRAQPAITRRISGEKEIEAARQKMLAAKAAVDAVYATTSGDEPPEGKALELVRAHLEADQKLNELIAWYPSPRDLVVVPFEIERAFRGTVEPVMFLLHERDELLEPDESYIVFANRPFPSPEFISAHARLLVMSAATESLRFLSLATEGNYGATVFGSVVARGAQESKPLADIQVRLTTGDQIQETATTSAGRFMFHGVPPGKARITPTLPPPLTLEGSESIELDIHGGGCRAVAMTGVPNGRVRGRVLHDDGTPLAYETVRLQAVHTMSGYRAAANTNDRGEYELTRVAPGTYVLGVNVDQQPTPRAPYRTNYFPGTSSREGAAQINVGFGTEHADFNWTLTDRLGTGELRLLTGVTEIPVTISACVVTRLPGGARSTLTTDPERIPVVDGVHYRIQVYGETAAGYFHSTPFEFTGRPGTTSMAVPVLMSATRSDCSISSP